MNVLAYGDLNHHINPVRNFGIGLKKHGLNVKYIGKGYVNKSNVDE